MQTDGSVPNKLSVWNVDVCKVGANFPLVLRTPRQLLFITVHVFALA